MRSFLLFLLRLVERVLGPLRQRLEERAERLRYEAKHREHGGFVPGQWIRVASVTCERCRKNGYEGKVLRVRRFTTEARRLGEWVFDRPFTGFCCAAGTKLEAASEPGSAT